MFDSERFNGFVKNELDDLLLEDIWNFYVFNESDLHSAAYYYVREYFKKRGSKGSEEIFVRCEPVIEDGLIPDIVVYGSYEPIYMIELKMFTRRDAAIDEQSISKDKTKLKSYLAKYPKLRWGFLIVVYDTDEMFKPSPYTLKKQGYERISVSTINLRRSEDRGRRRQGYDAWRKQYEKYLDRHRGLRAEIPR
mgnify:CR=1 FL=1